MSNATHTKPDQPPPDSARPSRLAWWLHPKVALPLTLFVLILLGPFLYRSYRISSIPDIGDPFDVAAFEEIVVPASDNAAEVYAAANAILVSGNYQEDLERVFENGWGDATDELQKWLTANEPALDTWRRGTELQTAQFILAKELSYDSSLPTIYELIEFSRLARLRAERCLHEGYAVEAWDWLRAAFRMSRHLGQHGPIVERSVAIQILSVVGHGIKHWSADPRVDEEALHNASEQFEKDDEMTPLLSIGMKYEYVSFLHTINSDRSMSDLGLLRPRSKTPDYVLRSFLFFIGEPEFSRRLMPHVFVGWLNQSDLSRPKRAASAGGWFGLYAPAPDTDQLSVSKLESHLLSDCLARPLFPGCYSMMTFLDREVARRAALKLMLAVQRYHRATGDWPKRPAVLVPDFLKELPTDPFGRSEEPLRLKRDRNDLIIYSIGDNGMDDGGAIAPVGSEMPDVGFRLKRPLLPSAEK